MAFREGYQKQVQLRVRALPGVAEEKDFALKGGTAINGEPAAKTRGVDSHGLPLPSWQGCVTLQAIL
jgi:type IV secretory pathway protease TraF